MRGQRQDEPRTSLVDDCNGVAFAMTESGEFTPGTKTPRIKTTPTRK